MKFAQFNGNLQIIFERADLPVIATLENVTLHCSECALECTSFHILVDHMRGHDALEHDQDQEFNGSSGAGDFRHVGDLRQVLRNRCPAAAAACWQPPQQQQTKMEPGLDHLEQQHDQPPTLPPPQPKLLWQPPPQSQLLLQPPRSKRARPASPLPNHVDLTSEPCGQLLPVVELKPDLNRVVQLNNGKYLNYPANEQFSAIANLYAQFLACDDRGPQFSQRIFDAAVALAEHLTANKVACGRQVDLIFQLGRDIAKATQEGGGLHASSATPERLASRLFYLTVQLLRPNSGGHMDGADACTDVVSGIRAIRHYDQNPSLERLAKLEESARSLSFYVGSVGDASLPDLSQKCILVGLDDTLTICRLFVCLQVLVVRYYLSR